MRLFGNQVILFCPAEFPRIVCLCGSTRFSAAFREARLQETLASRVVVTIGCDTQDDARLQLTPEQKTALDSLHLRKIELADEVLVLNVDGYIGESTARELDHARRLGKQVRWLEPDKAPKENPYAGMR